jgi:hypothetical protein
MFLLAFSIFSMFAFGMAIYHFLQKGKLLTNNDLTVISGKVSNLDISSFGRNSKITVKLDEFPNEIFLTDRIGFDAAAKNDLKNDANVGETVYLSLLKDEKSVFDARNFYELKTNKKLYLTIENYNEVWQKYHAGNMRLGLIGGVICFLIAALFLLNL